MKKSDLKKLKLNKETIAKLDLKQIQGGGCSSIVDIPLITRGCYNTQYSCECTATVG